MWHPDSLIADDAFRLTSSAGGLAILMGFTQTADWSQSGVSQADLVAMRSDHQPAYSQRWLCLGLSSCPSSIVCPTDGRIAWFDPSGGPPEHVVNFVWALAHSYRMERHGLAGQQAVQVSPSSLRLATVSTFEMCPESALKVRLRQLYRKYELDIPYSG